MHTNEQKFHKNFIRSNTNGKDIHIMVKHIAMQHTQSLYKVHTPEHNYTQVSKNEQDIHLHQHDSNTSEHECHTIRTLIKAIY